MRGNYLYKKLGEKIIKERKVKRISQDRLALLSDIDRTYLIRIEKGLANPTVKVLNKLAKNLEMKMSKLLKGI